VQSPPELCETRAEKERHGYLSTVSRAGEPHIVPVTFAFVHDAVAVGIDEKPKGTNDLKRVRNIRESPRVALLWDRYDEDWSKLWWVRADGSASVTESGPLWQDAWAALNAKYQQYAGREHLGAVILVTVDKWSGWSFG
jgi:PPOX class probable F420-dependent enzyme